MNAPLKIDDRIEFPIVMPPLAAALDKALTKARELGLLDDTRDNINSHDGGVR
jgi:hypothetical protein